jgi:hypothetical protein
MFRLDDLLPRVPKMPNPNQLPYGEERHLIKRRTQRYES